MNTIIIYYLLIGLGYCLRFFNPGLIQDVEWDAEPRFQPIFYIIIGLICIIAWPYALYQQFQTNEDD